MTPKNDAVHLESSFETFVIQRLITNGWIESPAEGYKVETGLNERELIDFVSQTQKDVWSEFARVQGGELRASQRLTKRVADEITHRGTVDVLRKGVKDTGFTFKVSYFAASNDLSNTAAQNSRLNRLSVSRQVHCSETKPLDSVDLVLFLNGVPLSAIELKSQTAGQNAQDAVRQFRFDRNPSNLIFRSRVLVNFALDEDNIYMATKLAGASTEFKPFNQGSNGPGKSGGAGNPMIPGKIKTSYLWDEVLQRDTWLEIIGSFVHVAMLRDPSTGKLSGERQIIFPRFHQWHAVRSLLDACLSDGARANRLCQHSAGSGKSNTISWLAHRLSVLHATADSKTGNLVKNQPVFDKVIIITDRRILDKQLRDTVASFDHQLGSIVSVTDEQGSKNEQLRDALESKAAKIIITTLQTFPVLSTAVTELAGSRFAVIADEAHSSQTGEASKDLKQVLSGTSDEEILASAEEFDDSARSDPADLTELLETSAIARGRTQNVTFFAFTATPKAKTLELFGDPQEGAGGERVFVPFHLYSMRQAIEEGYILDVLSNYTTYATYYRLANGLDARDLKVPKSRASSALARFASLHPANLAQKAEIIVEHYRRFTSKRIGGKAKALVVTRSRLHAVRYKRAIDAYISSKNYRDIRTLVAFSGAVFDPELPNHELTETALNGIPSSQIPKEFRKSYQVLVVAEKFQTGFDEPLLHTMYVDKKLGGVNAVQTLSRLNRVTYGKEDTFVLDFANNPEDIQEAFRPYYEGAVADHSDPNILHNLESRILTAGVVEPLEMDLAVQAILTGGVNGVEVLRSNTDSAVDRWNKIDDEAAQEDFRSALRDFVRAYAFLGQILPLPNTELEELYYYSKYLFTRLPGASEGGAVDVDSSVVLTHIRTDLLQQEASISISPGTQETLSSFLQAGRGAEHDEPEALLSALIATINERFGMDLTESDRIWFDQQLQHLSENPDIKAVAEANDFENFEIFLNPVIEGNVIDRHESNAELFTAFFDKPDFQELVTQTLARALYRQFNP